MEVATMPDVVTPFSRKSQPDHPRSATANPRHRRDGYFDEHDQWHEGSETAQADRAHG
jgi:hypothetical protein